MFLSFVLNALLPLILCMKALAAPQQIPLVGQFTEDAVLARFTASLGRDIHAVLDAAQISNADIWQVGPSYVDVYFPSSREYIASPLRTIDDNVRLTHVPTVLPPSTPPPATSAETWNLTTLSNTTFHASYHPLHEIEIFTRELVRLYPDLVDLVPIGHTAVGREMYALEISASKDKTRAQRERGTSSRSRKGFVITGAQHSREWIATSTAMYLAHALVTDASEPHSMAALLNAYDFYVVLVPNPDGYVHTWENDRFWYKNRQIIGANEKCVGVDMNRNWGHKWKPTAKFPNLGIFNVSEYANTTDSVPGKTDPCAPWYPGHRPFESPEVNNIANYITTLPVLQAFVDLRSYGQMLTVPYSYSCKKTPKDAEDQIEAALGAVRALKSVHGTAFTTGSLCEMLYRAPGNIVDYMYAKAGIKYSYAAHLRDTGTYGFALPPEWIRPVGEETANMIQSLAGFIAGKKF